MDMMDTMMMMMMMSNSGVKHERDHDHVLCVLCCASIT